MPEQTKPTAEGSFQKTPLSNVLLYARERKMTGTFVVTIEPEDPATRATLDVAGQSIVVVEGGNVVAVSLPANVDTLASVLLDMELITEEVFGKVQESLKEPGADEVPTLLRLRAIDPVGLDKGLREFTRRKVLSLFGFPNGSYAYYADVDLLNGADRARGPADVFPIVWRGMLAHAPDEATVAGVLDKIGGRTVRLKDGHEFQRFEFGDEVGVAGTQILVGPTTIDQLVGVAPDASIVRSMMYLLALTKQLEAVAAPSPGASAQTQPVSVPQGRGFTAFGMTTPTRDDAPAAPTGSAQPVAPIAPPPVPTAKMADNPLVKEARALLARLDQQTYFEMFGLTINATPAEISAGFTEQAALYHPDRAPLPEMRKLYQEIFAHLNTAHATLQDPKTREQYEASLSGGGGTPAAQKKVVAVLDTVQDMHRGEIALRRKDYVEAEKHLRKVLAANSEDMTATLMLAQCLFDRDPVGLGEEAQRLVSSVLRATEGNDKALFLMGSILKARDDKRYFGFYKAALEANPKHPEAQREMRLNEMRRQQRQKDNTTEGKIKNFFKGLIAPKDPKDPKKN